MGARLADPLLLSARLTPTSLVLPPLVCPAVDSERLRQVFAQLLSDASSRRLLEELLQSAGQPFDEAAFEAQARRRGGKALDTPLRANFPASGSISWAHGTLLHQPPSSTPCPHDMKRPEPALTLPLAHLHSRPHPPPPGQGPRVLQPGGPAHPAAHAACQAAGAGAGPAAGRGAGPSGRSTACCGVCRGPARSPCPALPRPAQTAP
jgi:hypothetical protein